MMHDSKEALLLVDLQNDFFPGRSQLGVPGADAVFPLANELQDYFQTIIASKDWHPKNHKSFAANHPGHKAYDVIDLNGFPQVLWPVHCVQGTKGAEFHSQLKVNKISRIIYKGIDPLIDSYSAFFDNKHQKSTGLSVYLSDKGINSIYVMGLATDYCVQYTVLDALQLGLKVSVIQDGCFGNNREPNGVESAIATMKNAGALFIQSQDIMHKDTQN